MKPNRRFATIAVATFLALIPILSIAAQPFRATLSGGDEVPPRDTPAGGQVMFFVSRDTTEIRYRLNVHRITNVVGAHIHLAPAGENGPVVVTLYGPVAPGGGSASGVLAEGTITASDLEGPLAGGPLTDLLAAMAAGSTYVNVHTDDGVAPADTGPGDFPGGEIRGQIR